MAAAAFRVFLGCHDLDKGIDERQHLPSSTICNAKQPKPVIGVICNRNWIIGCTCVVISNSHADTFNEGEVINSTSLSKGYVKIISC